MPLLITCDCGARFEVDDLLAGQNVRCPECQLVLKASARGQIEQRTSLLALFSLVLALAGAFTIVGSVTAVALGLVALAHIARRPDRLTGTGFAFAGIALGIAFTGVTSLLLWNIEQLPLTGWLRQRILAGRIDPAATWPASSIDGVCILPRPSEDWVRLRGNHSNDGAVDDLQTKRDALLAHRRRRAYLDIARDVSPPRTLPEYEDQLRTSMQGRPPLVGEDENDGMTPHIPPEISKRRDLTPVDGYSGREWRIDIQRGGQTWRFLVRAWRKESFAQPTGPIYLIRAYAPLQHFRDIEEELMAALNSVRFPP